MYCPNCHYQMVVTQRRIDEKHGITFRMYSCKRFDCDIAVETYEVFSGRITTKKQEALKRALTLKTAMKKIARDMRNAKCENDLERQALIFAAGWIGKRSL